MGKSSASQVTNLHPLTRKWAALLVFSIITHMTSHKLMRKFTISKYMACTHLGTGRYPARCLPQLEASGCPRLRVSRHDIITAGHLVSLPANVLSSRCHSKSRSCRWQSSLLNCYQMYTTAHRVVLSNIFGHDFSFTCQKERAS